MRSLLRMLLTAVLISPLPITTTHAANDNGSFVSSDGSFSFVYPHGWNIIASSKDKVILSNGQYDEANDLHLEINFPKTFTEYQQNGLGNSPLAVAQSILTTWRDTPPIRTNGIGITTLTPVPTPQVFATKATIDTVDMVINGRAAARGHYYDAKFGVENVRLLYVLDVGHGYCVVIYATSFAAETTLLNYEPIVKAIAQSMAFDAAKYIAPTPTADPFSVNSNRMVKWTTEQGTLTFNNPDGWYFVQTENGNFIQNTPEHLDNNQPRSGIIQAKITLPFFVRQDYLWNQLTKEGWHSDSKGDEQIIKKLDCASVTPEITAAVIVSSYIPSPDQRNELLQKNGTKFDDTVNTRLGNKNVAILRISSPTNDILILAVDVAPGDVVGMGTATFSGELKQYEKQLFEIASTFHYARSAKCKPT